MTTGKIIALTIWTLVGKVMFLLFNILSRFVIAFLPRSKRLLILWLQSVCSDFGAQENKVCHCFHCFPIYLPWSNGLDPMNSFFWMLGFKLPFSLSSFTVIKRLFSFSSLSAIKGGVICISEVIDIFLAVLIPACALSSLVFHMMYSTYKLNKQGDHIEPWLLLSQFGTSPLFHVQF